MRATEQWLTVFICKPRRCLTGHRDSSRAWLIGSPTDNAQAGPPRPLRAYPVRPVRRTVTPWGADVARFSRIPGYGTMTRPISNAAVRRGSGCDARSFPPGTRVTLRLALGSPATREATMVQTYGLTHVALAVSDAERSFRFYEQVFGSVAVYRQRGFVQAQTPGCRDVLVFEENGAHRGTSGGIAHFGFRLRDPADIDAAVDAVEKAGGHILRRGDF